MSETVRQLVRDSGFPGMKVLEFAFDSRDTGSASDYLPHNYPVNSVAYTGTHDNETLVSWYQTVTDAERAMVRDYLYDYATPEEQLYKSMIALILRSAGPCPAEGGRHRAAFRCGVHRPRSGPQADDRSTGKRRTAAL